MGVHTRNPHAVAMNVQHDLCCFSAGTVENTLQDLDDKLHRGVIVVVQQDLVHSRRFELLLGLNHHTIFGLLKRSIAHGRNISSLVTDSCRSHGGTIAKFSDWRDVSLAGLHRTC